MRWTILLLLCHACAHAGVYKWTDKEGRIHYSDAPPAEAKAAQVRTRISSIKGPPVVSQSSLSSAIRPTGSAAKVRMFTTPQCGYCKKAKAFLQARGTPFEELDVEASTAAQAQFEAIGGRGVPVILVGDRRMDGFGQERLQLMLESAGL